jgi:hypothetical protein
MSTSTVPQRVPYIPTLVNIEDTVKIKIKIGLIKVNFVVLPYLVTL